MKNKSLITSFLGITFIFSAYTTAVEPNTVVATIDVGVNPGGMAITPELQLTK